MRQTLRLGTMMVLLLATLAWTTPSLAEPDGAFAQQVVDLANQERANAGMWGLNWNDALAADAAAYAQDMADRNYFSHYSPEGSSPYDRAQGAGYPSYDWGTFVGENLALGYSSPEDAMQGWMASDGHRDNLLRPEFVDTGVGVAEMPDGQLVWVQVFGRSPAEDWN